jgi:hypothetical protein
VDISGFAIFSYLFRIETSLFWFFYLIHLKAVHRCSDL